MLSGYKTYILSIVAVIYGVSGFFYGVLDAKAAVDIIWAGLTGASMRAAIAKV